MRGTALYTPNLEFRVDYCYMHSETSNSAVGVTYALEGVKLHGQPN